MIALRKGDFICEEMGKITGDQYKWLQTKQAKMINPLTFEWWGMRTMGVISTSDEARNARLLGIAMMLTMPEDMIDPNL